MTGTPTHNPVHQANANADGLGISGCIRSRGVRDSPDATSSSSGRMRISIPLHGSEGSGSNPCADSTIFQDAENNCLLLMQAGLPGAGPAT